jgi:hypothetical protein
MKKALISPSETIVRYISSWTSDVPAKPIFSDIPNACRVAQVEDVDFEVAPPLYWMDCEDYVNDYEYYFDTQTNAIEPIPNVTSGG